MAQYRVTTTSFIDNKLVHEGDTVEYDGIPHSNLEPLDNAGAKAAKGAAQSDLEAIARMKAAAGGANPDEVDTVAATTAAAQAAQQTLAQQGAAAGLV
jgi:hypothetical protein